MTSWRWPSSCTCSRNQLQAEPHTPTADSSSLCFEVQTQTGWRTSNKLLAGDSSASRCEIHPKACTGCGPSSLPHVWSTTIPHRNDHSRGNCCELCGLEPVLRPHASGASHACVMCVVTLGHRSALLHQQLSEHHHFPCHWKAASQWAELQP